MSEDQQNPQEQLSQLFGSYKAEWLREELFDLYTEPSYFPELTTARPCLLLGGRGTGKTSVLRSLSYEGQYALQQKNFQKVVGLDYIGLYYRVDTNRVAAFKGPELEESRWIKTFGHYFNLVLCDLILRFLEWYQVYDSAAPHLDVAACGDVASSLHLPDSESVQSLRRKISRALIDFEAYINNVADQPTVRLSLQGAPVDVLCKEVMKLPHFNGKIFFFLLDEYENFEDYQQRAVNTLIKHAGTLYTFKIGVKELGWRVRSTLNANEQLISPADYVRISISEKLEGELFANFALTVCDKRVKKLRLEVGIPASIKDVLVELNDEEEANLLDGGDGIISSGAIKLQKIVPDDTRNIFTGMSDLEKFFLVHWAEEKNENLNLTWEDYVKNADKWRVRYGNYKHSLLFSIRRGKRGICKYYSGWSVFTHLAANNIRYLLELVDQALNLHLQTGAMLSDKVTPKTQTVAAQKVGRKNLAELEGLSVHGAQLTKLLLGLGRILQVLAADPGGHTPELNQFRISDENEEHVDVERAQAVEDLVRSAIMHLALIRTTGTKAASEKDTKEYDYMVHPIFSAFFVFSYRRKRKFTLSTRQLNDLVRTPSKAIKEVLAIQERSDYADLPEQMSLFATYYAVTP